ncbi:AMP-binding protein [uncultured Jatrophihabitans sp.]|uniref:AMP-binding protein n=1 Tax=uncultured Jatrophihabitans sp. TaxID=1610747 RepID=UPI0035CAB2C2
MSAPALDLPRLHATRRPTAIALADADTGRACTWRELDLRVGRAATVLADRFGVAPGDRVVLISENDPRVFELQFACMRLGAVFAPLNWRLAVVELHDLVQDAAPALIVHDGVWREVALELAAKASTSTLSWADDDAGAGHDYEALCGVVDETQPRPAPLDEHTHLLYTSGTTGRPKGALSSHGTLLWQATNLSHTSALTPSAHLLDPLPLFHAGGLLTVAMPVLHYGGRVTIMRRIDPAAMLGSVLTSEPPVTHLSLIPMMYAAMAALPAFADADLSRLRCAVVAGAVAPPDLLQAWLDRGAAMQPQYGGTEMGPCALVLDVGEGEGAVAKALAGSSGRPAVHTDVRLVDLVTGADVAPGRTGEIVLRGPSITRGYWQRPAGESRDDDGWFHTGDVGWRDDDGFYYYAGRCTQMYKSGGENVHPAEVEAALQGCPDVAEIAVIGVPDDTWGEVGLAVVVPAPGRAPTLEALRAFGAGRVARYKLPAAMVVVDELAHNVTGKVSRTRLTELYSRRSS